MYIERDREKTVLGCVGRRRYLCPGTSSSLPRETWQTNRTYAQVARVSSGVQKPGSLRVWDVGAAGQMNMPLRDRI